MSKKKPPSPLSASYSFAGAEKKWYAFWEENEFFEAVERKPGAGQYCIVIPPPNITGLLHMGHALTNTLQDILIRWQRMRGKKTLWVPGIDHAGIATQTAVEKHLIQSEGKRRRDCSRREFTSHIWRWKSEKEQSIIDQLKRLGCSCSWSHYRFTLDEYCSLAVKKSFKRLFDEKILYRGNYLVNWDPITQTALADDEVEYEEKHSSLWYFRYPFVDTNGKKEQFISIATTRPETILGDSAVAVSPRDPRYAHLIGQEILLPLMNRRIPLIADDYVDPQFGTGAVKITPAHDPNDYEIGKRHQLPCINIMKADGRINETGGKFSGFPMLEARKAIVKEMQALGYLEKIEPHTHRIGRSYRSHAIIEPYLSKQWFIRMQPFKKRLREIVFSEEVKLIPSSWKNTYFHWIDNLRDWCISRQLWWGHRIPIWYHRKDPSRMVCEGGEGPPLEVIQHPDEWIEEEDVLDTWFSSALWPFSVLGWPDQNSPLQEFYPNNLLVTGHDILFFWVARMIMMGEYLQPWQGSGQRSRSTPSVPFSKVLLHGLIYGKSYWEVDREGNHHYIMGKQQIAYDMGVEKVPEQIHARWEKMSKSKGNVIDPLEMIAQYGTDATRMALCSCPIQSAQIDLDRRNFEEYKNFANKIWNGARFIFLHLDGNRENSSSPLTEKEFLEGIDREVCMLEDFWILSRLDRTISSVNRNLSEHALDRAAKESYDFFWNTFCAYYVEISKPILFQKSRGEREKKNRQRLLLILLTATLRLLHPMAPVITEEIFQQIKIRYRFEMLSAAESESERKSKNSLPDPYVSETVSALCSPACIIAPYPEKSFFTDTFPKEQETQCEQTFQQLTQVVYTVRNMRGEMQLPLSLSIDLYFFSPDSDTESADFIKEIQNNIHILYALLKVHRISFRSGDSYQDSFGSSASLGKCVLFIPLPDQLQEKEKKRLLKEREETAKKLERVNAQLSNQQFITRAPDSLVRKTRENKKRWETKYSQMEESLKKL